MGVTSEESGVRHRHRKFSDPIIGAAYDDLVALTKTNAGSRASSTYTDSEDEEEENGKGVSLLDDESVYTTSQLDVVDTATTSPDVLQRHFQIWLWSRIQVIHTVIIGIFSAVTITHAVRTQQKDNTLFAWVVFGVFVYHLRAFAARHFSPREKDGSTIMQTPPKPWTWSCTIIGLPLARMIKLYFSPMDAAKSLSNYTRSPLLLALTFLCGGLLHGTQAATPRLKFVIFALCMCMFTASWLQVYYLTNDFNAIDVGMAGTHFFASFGFFFMVLVERTVLLPMWLTSAKQRQVMARLELARRDELIQSFSYKKQRAHEDGGDGGGVLLREAAERASVVRLVNAEAAAAEGATSNGRCSPVSFSASSGSVLRAWHLERDAERECEIETSASCSGLLADFVQQQIGRA